LPIKLKRGWSLDHGEKGETPKEANPRRVAVFVSSMLMEKRTLAGSKTLKWGALRDSTTRGYGRSKERTALRAEIGPEGKPHGRDRHETRPADGGRSKTLRACETLRR
jgi:hypothetical protein